MKKCVLWTIFLFAGFSLFAQTRGREFSVYILPVSGQGLEPEDNAFLSDRLTLEFVEHTNSNYFLTGNRNSADYVLEGTLAIFSGGAESRDARERLVSFRLALSENGSREEIAGQTLIYSGREELNRLLPSMVSNVISGASGLSAAEDDWRGKMWYFGGVVYWTPRIYYGITRSGAAVNFGAGVLAEFHFLNFLSLEAGVEAAPDWIAVSAKSGDDYWDMIMEIPLSLKLVLKPGANLMIEPYGGIHCNISMYGATVPYLFSWRAGLQYGIKAGPGVFFVEPRFSADLGNSALKADSGKTVEYRRYEFYLGLGYKFGVKDRF